jgi:hypothetical protein
MIRWGQSLHAFKLLVDSNRNYSLSDILGSYARVMNGYHEARKTLPPLYQEILDLVFASVRFGVNASNQLGSEAIKHNLGRIGLTENEKLNTF